MLLAACGGGSQIADTPTPETKVVAKAIAQPTPTNELPKPEPTATPSKAIAQPTPTNELPKPEPTATPSKSDQVIDYLPCSPVDGSIKIFSDGSLNDSGDPSQKYVCSNEDGTLNDSLQQQIDSGVSVDVVLGLESTPTPTSTPTQAATSFKDRYIDIGYNTRQDTFAQEIVAATDVPQAVIEEWHEVQKELNAVIGSYNRYLMLITTTQDFSQPVFDRLKEVGWESELRIVNGQLINASCLTGSGEHFDHRFNPYSLCIMDYEFIQWPHETKQSGESKSKRQAVVYHGWAHEYFHKYQGTYTLDRAFGSSIDCCGLRNPIEAPAWYGEGQAIIFPNLWLRHAWKELSAFKGLTFDDVNVEQMDLEKYYKEARATIRGLPNESGDIEECDAFTSDEESYDKNRCSWLHWGMFNAYIAHLTSYQTLWVDMMEDFYLLGFPASFEKHVGMTQEEAYASYNAFMKTGPVDAPSPAGFFPEGPISGYVDFFSHRPAGLSQN